MHLRRNGIACPVLLGCQQSHREHVSGDVNLWIQRAGAAGTEPDIFDLALVASGIAADINVDAKQFAFIGTAKGSGTSAVDAFAGDSTHVQNDRLTIVQSFRIERCADRSRTSTDRRNSPLTNHAPADEKRPCKTKRISRKKTLRCSTKSDDPYAEHLTPIPMIERGFYAVG